MPKTTEKSGLRGDRGLSYQKLERIAMRVRGRLNLSHMEHVDALSLFGGYDFTVRTRNGRDIPIRGNVIDSELSEGYSKYNCERQVIEILASTETYEWLEQDYPRGRFFLAHELGHCQLHTDQLVRLAQLATAEQAALHFGSQGGTHPVYRDTEWQANAFAGAFLMPARGILALEQKFSDSLSPIEIAEQFRVSIEAASYRLQQYTKRKHKLL